MKLAVSPLAKQPARRLVRHLRALVTRTEGASAVEFALIVPLLLLILAGVVDLGSALKAKFDLNAAVSAAANYALLNASSVNSTDGAALADKLADIAKGSLSGGYGDIDIGINGGTSVVFASGQMTKGGSASNADKCYCPTGSGAAMSYGSAVACGSVCSSGGTAGKFITIRAAKPHSPLFGGFGIVDDGEIAIHTVVRPQ